MAPLTVTHLGSLLIIDACQGCGACILTCPERALRPARDNPAVDRGRCTGCGECTEVCPVDAIGFAGPFAGPAPTTGRRDSVRLEH